MNTTELKVTDFRRLEILGNILKETLRIYPPLTMVVRKLLKDVDIQGQHLPEDTLVACVFQLTHHDERVLTKPELFDPNRFSKERKEHMKCPYAYAPFGTGPHHCIGYSFTEIQIKMVMTQLLQQFQLSKDPDHQVPI